MVNFTPHAPHENRLLAALPREEYKRLLPHLELVALPKHKILYDVGDNVPAAYFVMRGMVSLLSTTEDGAEIEVGMIGKEGMVGIPIILRINVSPYRTMVQIPGVAMKLKASVLREEFARDEHLQELLLRYTHTVITQITQSAVCNRFHTTEERLSRWLLISRDVLKSNTISLTQEFLAHMMGVPRTSVTMTAGNLQRANLISYSRGKIQILNPDGLEEYSCECYRVIRESFKRDLAA